MSSSRDDVSRETPSTPGWAAQIFSDRLDLAERYVALLADAGVVRGLIGPREVPRLWERHLLNCALVSDALGPEDRSVADIGSGAGLPGLVLAIRRPELRVTLVEPLLRRVTFLQEAIDVLGLTNVEVVRSRAEDLTGRTFDVVTARAVAPLDRLVRWGLPLVRPGGTLLAMKGSSAEEEVEASRSVVHRAGGGGIAVERFGADWSSVPTTVVRIERRR